nr:reverse transcriptase domain-containing protein [Tanacetum cinerariifolium]
MDMTIDQQVALDEALVTHASRLRIGNSNFRLRSDITSKELTLQVVYDVLRLTLFYQAFLVTADVPEIYTQEFWATATVHHHSIRFKMNNKKRIINLEYFREMLHICLRIPNQTFDELLFEEEILAFLRNLGHSGEIKNITNNVEFAYLMWEDFVYQVKLKDAKKSNEMYYPRFTKVIINFFMTKDPSIPRRNKFGAMLPVELTNKDIRNTVAYNEYYAIASGVAPPKTKASVRKTQSSERHRVKSSDKDYDDDDVDDQSDAADDDDDDQEDEDEQDDDDQDNNDDDQDSDNEGDDFVHPKLTTHDEEAKDEESFDPSLADPTLLNDFEMAAEGNGDPPVPDLRTMEELCQPSLNSRGVSHGQNLPPAYQASAYQALGFQAPVHQPSIPQPQVVTTAKFTNYMKANDAILKNMQTNMNSLINSNLALKNMFGQFMKMNTASSSGSGTLLSNTITNPKEDLKGITTQSGTSYLGPTIPTTSSSLPQVVECETELTKDTVPLTNNRSTKDIQPLVVQVETPIPNFEPVVAPVVEPIVFPVSDLKPNPKPSIPYPSRLHDQKLHDKTNYQKEKIFKIFQDLNFKISFADALILMPKFGPTIKSLLNNKDKLYELARTPLNEHYSAVLLKKLPEKLGDPGKNYNDITANRIDVTDMACEEYLQEVLGFSDVIPSGNPTPYYDLIVSTSSSTLTPFGDSDFLLEEVDAFLALEDDPTSREVDDSYYDPKGEILLLEAFLNDDPSLPPPNQGMYFPQVELKDLPPHLKYVFLEGDNKLPVIIAKDFCVKVKAALIKVLKSHKKAIYLKLSDIKGINPKFCTHKILMEDDFEPAVQHQRRVNPKIYNVIKKEEKSHFIVKEGIVLGYKISKNEIEVDKAKVDVIAKLPHPSTVK